MAIAPQLYKPPSHYDPQALGAKCDQCYLKSCRAGGPVPPEVRSGAVMAVVGESPKQDEVQDMRPFTGASGKELTLTLKLAGLQRGQYDLFFAIACQPIANKLESINRACKRANDAIDKHNKEERKAAKIEKRLPMLQQKWMLPLEACRPRLFRELADHQNLMVAGKLAYQAVMGEAKSLFDVRGGMLDGWLATMDLRKGYPSFVERKPDSPWTDANLPAPDAQVTRILPAMSPGFVMKQRRWTGVFRSDVKRAVDWFTGRAEWEEPDHVGGMHVRPGQVTLRDPSLPFTVKPDPDWLYNWLLPQETLTYDTETDGLEALLAKVRCVSIGSNDVGVVIPLMSKTDPRQRFYSPADERRMIDVLRWWWTSKDHLKVGWNNGLYDRLIVEQNFGVTPFPILDCMMLHRVVAPELPHGLGFAASVYASLSPAWKASRAATEAESDGELHRYASLDAVQNNRVADPLVALAEERGQIPVFLEDCGMQSVAANLHRIGVKIDVQRRNQWETILLDGGIDPRDQTKWEKKNGPVDVTKHTEAWRKWEVATQAWKEAGDAEAPKPERPKGPRVHRGALRGSVDRPSYIEELRHYANRPQLNPNSVPQIRDLLFEHWRLPIPMTGGTKPKPRLTGSGDPSTDDETIRALRIHPLVRDNKRIVAFLDALRFYRAKMKLYGTYIKRLTPNDSYVDADGFDMNVLDDLGRIQRNTIRNDSSNRDGDFDDYEDLERAAEEIRSQGQKVKGFLWPDHRVRADWKAHTTVVGRFSCSNPNLLNLPKDQRDMVIPEPGHCFVGADADQIHMRIFTARWKLKKYQAVFDLGGDPHAMTALLMFDDFRDVKGFPPGRWEGDVFIPVPGGKWSDQALKYRNLAKTIGYASAYMAQDETVHRVVTSAEDTEGNLIYADLDISVIREKRAAWVKGLGIDKGWEMEIALYRQQGYGEEPVLNRRRDFLDLADANENEGLNEIVNHPILGAEGSIMTKRTNTFVAAFPFDHLRKTGLVHQNYDSMCAEVDADINEVYKAEKRYQGEGAPKQPLRWYDEPNLHLREARRVAELMTEHMTWVEESLPGVVGTSIAQWGEDLKTA
jgi:DNA polymerase I-like protein with 3'-5' exonuclease and polymerase domains/uracil-DNA glycosylase